MNGDTKEKTEQPTRKKLRDARKKGSVAKSTDLVAAGTFTVILAMLALFHDHFSGCLKQIFQLLGANFHQPFQEAVRIEATAIFKNIVLFVLPILAVVVSSIVVLYILQFGLIAAADPVTPQFDKINPAEGFKRIFSLQTLVEAIKSTLKVVLLGLTLFFVIKHAISDLVNLPDWGINAILTAWLLMILKISVIAALFFLLIAFFDFSIQKQLYIRRNKMSKDEVIREYKDTEGNPLIKGRRRSLYMQMLAQATTQKARKATVIITNPVHYAVALYYKRQETGLPVVVTKGEHLSAREIVKIAEKAKVPVIRNVPLARALYFQVEIGEYIPRDLLEPVAEVIRWVLLNHPGAKI